MFSSEKLRRLVRYLFVGVVIGWIHSTASSTVFTQDSSSSTLSKALSFHASFDEGVDADFARGENKLFVAPKMNQRNASTTGLPTGNEVSFEPKSGRFGGALRFRKSNGPIVFYKTAKNFPSLEMDWDASVSFWLSTDPKFDLLEGFCDPIQITSKQWDDAAIFVEFEKRAAGIPFRLGVYADKKVWNPTGRIFDTIPMSERPLAGVENPPFAPGKWTHVVVVVQHFNTDQANGLSTLYLDGKKVSEISPRVQTFTWEPSQGAIMLGLNYIGFMDELSIFDRALSPSEVSELYSLKDGVRGLISK